MRALFVVLPVLAFSAWAGDSPSEAAIRKVIATFNNPRERASVLARDADIAYLGRPAGQGESQVYYEVKKIKLVSPDVAFVDGTASQYGSVTLKRSMRVVFLLNREGGVWRISVLRVGGRHW
jgi:hypothetical protein